MLAWCLYDLANTIFAMNMTSYHFPVWVVVDKQSTEWAYSLAFGLSMLASAVVMPGLGRHSDRKGNRVAWLIAVTLGCVFFTGVLGFIGPIWVALSVFALANFFYQLAGVFYNALLPSVSPRKGMGRVSGYGVALGYVGTLIGIVATAPLVAKWGRQSTFLPTGLLFLMLSLPLFFWVKDTAKPVPAARPDKELARSLKPLLLPACLGLSAVGAVTLFMSVYAKQAIGLSDVELQRLLITATAVTVAGTFLWGWITDRLGGYWAMWWVWALWAAAFGLGCLSFNLSFFYGMACMAGVALGGTWVASRVLLVEWVGPQRIGESFGLFGVVSRLSAVVGPALWSGVLWAAQPLGRERYRLSMFLLFVLILGGWVSYHRLRYKRPGLVR